MPMSALTVEIDAALRDKARALVAQDRAFFDRFLASRFRYVTASGYIADKAAYIEGTCGSDEFRFQSQDFTDLHLVVRDPLVIAFCDLSDVFVSRGAQHQERYKTMMVLERGNGTWQWVAGQTMQPAGR
jgi:hypothetical protein